MTWSQESWRFQPKRWNGDEWGISHNSGIGRKTWNNRLNHGILRITWKWDSWFNPKVNKFEFADSTGYRIVDFNSCWWILSSKNHGIWSSKFSGHLHKMVVLTPEKSRLLDDCEDFTWFYLLMLSYFATNFCACLQTIQSGDLRQQQWWFTMIEQTIHVR